MFHRGFAAMALAALASSTMMRPSRAFVIEDRPSAPPAKRDAEADREAAEQLASAIAERRQQRIDAEAAERESSPRYQAAMAKRARKHARRLEQRGA